MPFIRRSGCRDHKCRGQRIVRGAKPMTLSRLIILFAALVLTACATPTPYKPADSQGEAGYSDQRLTENRVRVIFRENPAAWRETVETPLWGRAGGVPRGAGFSCFECNPQNTKADTNY